MSFDEKVPIERLALSVLESLGAGSSAGLAIALEEKALNVDYYALLSVPRATSAEDIAAALERCRNCFPRLAFHVIAALDNAEAVLLHPERRAQYDATLD